MFRFHIQGLAIAVIQDHGVSVLLLNSAHPRKREKVPYHIQSLFTTLDSVADYTMPRLSSILGRWAPKPSDDDHVGWSIGGLKLTVGESGPVEIPNSTMSGREHPSLNEEGVAKDWSDTNWILDIRRMLPTATLRKEFRTLGADTHSIFEFHGGQLQGGEPFANGASQYTWMVHQDYEQAFTDTIDIVFPDGPPKVVAVDADGRSAGHIEFRNEGEAWIVNEAPSLAQAQMAVAGGHSPDMLVFLDAFDTETLREKRRVVFEVASRFGSSVPSGTSCDAGKYDERTIK